MLSWRWGGAILSAALVAGVAFVRASRSSQSNDVHHAPGASTGMVLAGVVEAPGVDLTRCQARCSPMRLESSSVVLRAELDARGRFAFTGLSDTDYRIEIVLRSNPALVVARHEYARPGGDELVVLADPVQIYGPSGNPDPDSQ